MNDQISLRVAILAIERIGSSKEIPVRVTRRLRMDDRRVGTGFYPGAVGQLERERIAVRREVDAIGKTDARNQQIGEEQSGQTASKSRPPEESKSIFHLGLFCGGRRINRPVLTKNDTNGLFPRVRLLRCRIRPPPFVHLAKAGNRAGPKTGNSMPQYLIAIHHPHDFEPSSEDEEMHRNIDALNHEMEAAGARIFVGGLEPASRAKALRAQSDGKVHITDGPYLETKEYIGGFWVLKAANLDEALAWGRKAAIACRAPVEVRQFADPPI
jgi:hypothetical protein